MSGCPPFLKAQPTFVPACVMERSTSSLSSGDPQDAPTLPSHTVERGKKKKRTHPLWLKGTEVSPSPSQAWPVEHCTLWCINICLWLKFKQPCVAARHNRKPSSKGKCLLQWWPKEQLPAADRILLAGPACGVIIKHLATGHWPLGCSHPFSNGYVL